MGQEVHLPMRVHPLHAEPQTKNPLGDQVWHELAKAPRQLIQRKDVDIPGLQPVDPDAQAPDGVRVRGAHLAIVSILPRARKAMVAHRPRPTSAMTL
ncbi:MAG: hypothetical protein U9O54_06255 [Chloroflexota bacterium]|nr:hypothetical protein [Chloroflexota bacterium]